MSCTVPELLQVLVFDFCRARGAFGWLVELSRLGGLWLVVAGLEAA